MPAKRQNAKLDLDDLFAIEQVLLEREEENAAALNDDQRTVLALMALEREVGNGGFDQFFVNSSVGWTPILVASLRAVGCADIAEIAGEAIGVASKRDSPRRTRMLDELDQRYYATPGVMEAVTKFVLSKRESIGVSDAEIEDNKLDLTLPELPRDPVADALDRVWVLHGAGKHAEALRSASAVIRKYPKDPRPWFARSTIHSHAEDFSAAIRDAQRELALDPKELATHEWIADLHFRAARALYELGRYTEALAHLADLFPGYELLTRVPDPLMTKRGLVKACKAKIAQN